MDLNVKKSIPLTTVLTLFFIISSCKQTPPGESFVHQKIPVDIQSNTPITVEIRLSGNAPNNVGIRCLPEIWNTFTNSTKMINVELKSSNKKGTTIYMADPKFGGELFLGYITNVHYLFQIDGERHAKASVEITFPNAPRGVTHAEIIVGKTPEDTEAPF